MRDMGIAPRQFVGGFANDYALYQKVVAVDRDGISTYLAGLRRDAEAAGARLVFLTSEMFFTLPPERGGFPVLLEEMSRHFEEVRIIIVVRNLRSFMRSYLRQLIDNGALLLHDDQLAVWFVERLWAFWTLPVDVVTVSFDLAVGDKKLLTRFFHVVAGTNRLVPEVVENATPSRPLAFMAMRGVIARLVAARHGIHVNSSVVDQARTGVSEDFDRIVRISEDPLLITRTLDEISQSLGEEIEKYIDHCISLVSVDRMRLYERCVMSDLSENEFTGLALP
ncbi:MAG: hypothetical protein KDK07_02395 [Bauldia sp.]|nr:hypothetical protein [Bauldia sp.]